MITRNIAAILRKKSRVTAMVLAVDIAVVIVVASSRVPVVTPFGMPTVAGHQ